MSEATESSSGLSVSEMKPIWYSPAWIAAIVSLITALLTIPQVVGDYFEKEQEVELAEEKVRLAEIENEALLQNEHFKKLITVLRERSPQERKIVLRFMATTLNDQKTIAWALQELERIEEAVP